jgi:hypothetical protein
MGSKRQGSLLGYDSFDCRKVAKLAGSHDMQIILSLFQLKGGINLNDEHKPLIIYTYHSSR